MLHQINTNNATTGVKKQYVRARLIKHFCVLPRLYFLPVLLISNKFSRVDKIGKKTSWFVRANSIELIFDAKKECK